MRQDILGPKRSANRRGQRGLPNGRRSCTLLHRRQCAADGTDGGAAERWSQQDGGFDRAFRNERAQPSVRRLRMRLLGKARADPSCSGLLKQKAPCHGRHSGRERYPHDRQHAKPNPRHSKILSEPVGTARNRTRTAADRRQPEPQDKAYPPPQPLDGHARQPIRLARNILRAPPGVNARKTPLPEIAAGVTAVTLNRPDSAGR